MQAITFTRQGAGRYIHAESDVRIIRGESGKWLVYSPAYRINPQMLVTSRATLAQAKVVAKAVADRDLTRREAAHAEALQMEAARIVAEDSEDALVHYWTCHTDVPSACGVDIATTPYTYGSPEWPEVTCPVCISTRSVAETEA